MGKRRIGVPRIDLGLARNRIAMVWFAGAFVAVALVIGQSILGRFEEFAEEFWGWFTPTIFPTLALIVGVMGATAMDDDRERRTVKRFFFRAAMILSLVYFFILLATMLLEPFAGSHDMKYFNVANYWLSPIQGLVVAAIGALFNSRKRDEGGEKEEEENEPAKPRRRRRD